MYFCCVPHEGRASSVAGQLLNLTEILQIRNGEDSKTALPFATVSTSTGVSHTLMPTHFALGGTVTSQGSLLVCVQEFEEEMSVYYNPSSNSPSGHISRIYQYEIHRETC